MSLSLILSAFSYEAAQIYRHLAYRPPSRKNLLLQLSNPRSLRNNTVTRTHYRHLWQKPRSQSCPKTRRISTSTTCVLSRSWAAAFRVAKWYKGWYLVANRKVNSTQILDTALTHNPFQGIIKKVSGAKVAVFTCALDIAQTETKGTVLLKNADEMLNFTRGEEQQLERVCSPPFHNLLDLSTITQ